MPARAAGLVAVLNLVLLTAALPPPPAGAAAMKLWWDTFEDGNTLTWTIAQQGGATATIDATTANQGTRSLKVTGNSAANAGVNARSRTIPIDFTQDYTVQLAFRWSDFHWDRILLFGHIRLLLDYPSLPIRYDPIGNNSFPGNSVGAATFQSLLPANTWGWITVLCEPNPAGGGKYSVFVNGTLAGTVNYQASVVPTTQLFFEDNFSQNNFLNAWFDDFSVWGIQPAQPFAAAGLPSDPENNAGQWAQPPDVPYHSQFTVPDIAANLSEPCSPPRGQNFRCVVASLDMVFDRFETLPPAGAPPNPQEEIAAAANTTDRANCPNGQWLGTTRSDGRRAAHFSKATAALTAPRAGCPPQGCANAPGAAGYTWRELGYAATDGAWTQLAPQDSVAVAHNRFPLALESVLASGYPIMACFPVPPPDYCSRLQEDPSRGAWDLSHCPPEETVLGHCIVIIGYDNTGNQGGNPTGGPAFLIHDPGIGKYLWIGQQYFWDQVWTTKSFIFAAPWELLWLSPQNVTEGRNFDGTLLVTYPGPEPLDGLYPVANVQAKLTLTNAGLQGGEVLAHFPAGIARSGDSGFTTWRLVGPGRFRPQGPVVFAFSAWGRLAPAASSTSYANYADDIGASDSASRNIVVAPPIRTVDAGHTGFPYSGIWWGGGTGGSGLRLEDLGGGMSQVSALVGNFGLDPLPASTMCRFYWGDPTVAEHAPGTVLIGDAQVPPLAPGDSLRVGPPPWSRPPANGLGEPHFGIWSEIVCPGDAPASPWPQEENNFAALAEFAFETAAGTPVSMRFRVENPEPAPMEVSFSVDRDANAAAWTVEVTDDGGTPVPLGVRLPIPPGAFPARVRVTPTAGPSPGNVAVECFLYYPGGDLVRETGGVSLAVRVLASGLEPGGLAGAPGFALAQNAPNPFVSATAIRYAIPREGEVALRVYDVAGRLVRSLVAERQAAGWHEVAWTEAGRRGAARLPAGLYFYRLEVDGNLRSTRKMLLIH